MPRNPALATKVRAMQSQLLTNEDYKALISAENLTEVVRYLKDNTQYGPYLKHLEPENAGRGDVERVFSKLIVNNTEKLLHYVLGVDKNFLKLVLRRVELQYFLTLMGAISQGENLAQIKSQLYFPDLFSNVSGGSLENVTDWESLKEALKDTIYYRSIETYDRLDADTYFVLEKTMERAYYDNLLKRINAMGRDNSKRLVKLMRQEIDILNLIWIYRAKKFYHFSADRILPFVFIGGLYVGMEDLKRLASIDDYDELLEALRGYRDYAFLFDHPEEDMDLFMGRRRRRFMYYNFQKLLLFGNALTAAYSYLRLLTDEANDITSIIEGKRYDLPASEMEKFLIRSIN